MNFFLERIYIGILFKLLKILWYICIIFICLDLTGSKYLMSGGHIQNRLQNSECDTHNLRVSFQNLAKNKSDYYFFP